MEPGIGPIPAPPGRPASYVRGRNPGLGDERGGNVGHLHPSPADARSPEAQTLGSGPVVVHRSGVATVGTWSRDTATDPFTFADYAGAPVPLAGGTTFVELVRA